MRQVVDMFKSKTKILQLIVTLAACAFLFVPMILSVLAGVTANYFKGISSGLTLKWVFKVWELYAESILLSVSYTHLTLPTKRIV